MQKLALTSVLLLAACVTPQERCINASTAELRKVDRLIADVSGNIQRGYGFQDKVVEVHMWVDCTPPAVEGEPKPKKDLCFEPVQKIVQEPVALDMGLERRKLADLQTKKAELNRNAVSAAAQCRALHPE